MTKFNRFNGWICILAFSCVVVGSLVNDPEINFERNDKDKYVISCCSIAIILSVFTIAGYFSGHFSGKLVGIFEASIGTIVCALWCAAIAIVMLPRNNLAITTFGVTHLIRNTNLYFFSWAAFLSSAYVLTSIAQEYRLVDVEAAPLNLVRWYLLLIASVVVLGSSSKLKELTCSTDVGGDEYLCRITSYAISLGVVTAFLVLIPIIWTHVAKTNHIVETIVGVVVTIFYCVGAAYITDVTGPGSNIGNLYFATWFGFGLSVMLSFSCMKELIAPETEEEEESQHPEVTKTGQQGVGEHQGESSEGQRGGEGQLEEVDVEGRDEA